MKAPYFSLPDQEGKHHALHDYSGTWRVVYFYPKDDTPGCTTQACNFRNNMSELVKAGIHVFGISKDSVKSHKKFADKHSLNFPILADESLETIKAYNAWAPKKFMGREFMGTLRKTFLINPQDEITKVYEGMNLNEHAQEILKDKELHSSL